MNVRDFTDIHSHTPRPGAIANLDGFDVPSEGYWSVGIHPWDTEGEIDYRALDAAAAAPNVVAIGECGLDALRGAPLERQEEVFEHHVALSERLRKPLIIHAVRTLDRIIALRRQLRPSQLWIIHGFRGKPEQARQLLRAGIAISLGERFNPAAAAVIPDDMLFTETDESEIPISEIRARIRAARQTDNAHESLD